MQQIQGRKNIKNFLLNLLEEDISEMKSILSGKPLVYHFGEDFAEEFMQKRVQKNITLKSLRLTQDNFDTKKHSDYFGYLKEIRHVSCDEILAGDTIFLVNKEVIIFDVENMIAEIDNSNVTFERYMDIFEKNWNI